MIVKSPFVTPSVVDEYNRVNKVIDYEEITEDEYPKIYIALNAERIRLENERRRLEQIRIKKKLRKNIRKSGEVVNLGGMELVSIKGGSFMMGNNEYTGEDLHRVSVDSFWIGKYEVIQAQYEAVMGLNPSKFPGGNRPVEKVSWNDAMEFCEKVQQKIWR